MDFPYSFTLARPAFRFKDEKVHSDRRRGLIKHGPLKEAPVSKPNLLFVFTEDDKDFANRLYITLRNGVGQFPGCDSFVRISIERDRLASIRINDPKSGYKELAQVFAKELENYLSDEKNPRPDFAFVINSKQENPYYPDPYQASKAVLVKHGIPSQYVSHELIRLETQFKYAISNIALGMLVKLGGVPWSVKIQKDLPTLVLGLSTKRLFSTKEGIATRWYGFSTNVLSSGIFIDTDFFPPATEYSEFLKSLQVGLTSSISRLLDEQRGIRKVTIHVSSLESRETIRVVQEVVASLSIKSQAVIPFEIVKLNSDSDFGVLDLDSAGYAPAEGTCVALGPRRSLLVTEGRDEMGVWRGRKPVTLEIQRVFSNSDSIPLRETVDDAFYLSSVNWRGLNVHSEPISLKYAHLLASQLAKLTEVDPDIVSSLHAKPVFRKTPWFI